MFACAAALKLNKASYSQQAKGRGGLCLPGIPPLDLPLVYCNEDYTFNVATEFHLVLNHIYSEGVLNNMRIQFSTFLLLYEFDYMNLLTCYGGPDGYWYTVIPQTLKHLAKGAAAQSPYEPESRALYLPVSSVCVCACVCVCVCVCASIT